MKTNCSSNGHCISIKPWITGLALAWLCAGPISTALGEYFLILDGIQGESKKKGYENSVEVVSWSWGETNPTSNASGGGQGAGKVSMKEFSFTMRTSKASPPLFLACAKGSPIKSATLCVAKVSGTSPEYLRWKLQDVTVASFSTQSDPAGSATALPMDSVTLRFNRVDVEYTPFGTDGKPQGKVKAGWDLKANKQTASVTEAERTTPAVLSGVPPGNEISAQSIQPYEETRGDARYLAIDIVRAKDPNTGLIVETSEDLKEWAAEGVIQEVVEDSATFTKLHLLMPMDRAQKYLKWQATE